jgi:hypothetical protein
MFNISNATLKGKVLNALLKGQSEAVAGTTADTNIAVANIAATSEVITAWDQTNGVELQVSAQSAGNVQFASDTTGATIVVTWI